MEKQLFEFLLERLVDFSIVPKGQTLKIYADTEGTLHERLILSGLLTKPSWEEFLAEEEDYNSELAMAAEKARVENEAREAEELRVQEWQARLEALEYIAGVMRHFENPISSIALVRKAIIDSKDESILIQYEESHVPIKAEIEKKEARRATIDAGKGVNQLCNDVLDFISGYNYLASTPEVDIDQMQINLEDIETWLRKSRPKKAYNLILAIDNPLYNELKATVLEIYAEYN